MFLALSGAQMADSSAHLWRLEMLRDLPESAHVAEVTASDKHGRQSADRIVLDVRAERPFPLSDNTLWEDASN